MWDVSIAYSVSFYIHLLYLLLIMADTMKPVEDVDVKETSSDENRLAITQHMSTEEFREAEKKLKRKLDVRLLACMWLIFILNYLDRVCSLIYLIT